MSSVINDSLQIYIFHSPFSTLHSFQGTYDLAGCSTHMFPNWNHVVSKVSILLRHQSYNICCMVEIISSMNNFVVHQLPESSLGPQLCAFSLHPPAFLTITDLAFRPNIWRSSTTNGRSDSCIQRVSSSSANRQCHSPLKLHGL